MLKPRSNIFVSLAVFLALVLVAASCGDDDSSNSIATDSSATETADDAVTEEAAEPESDDSAEDDGAGDGEDEDETDEGDDDGAAESVPTSDDVTDLTAKPPIDESLLGSYDTLEKTDIVVGAGDEAIEGATLLMMYVGVLGEDGTEFDNSWDGSPQPFSFQLGAGGVIPGWDEGILGMKVGGRRVLQVPSDLAYGSQARGEIIGPDSDLLFIVDLIGVLPPPPTVPEDALGPFDELGIIEITEGTGEAVKAGDIIEVQYVGVTGDDGTEFDSTYSRGGEAFRLVAGKGAVIEGWNEGLLGMKVGGERIVQIPSAMAYDEGDLVFLVILETLIEAPFAHTLTFEGDVPDEVEVTTLIEGSGDGAKAGDAVEANITILVYSTSEIVQSTYVDQGTTAVVIQEDSLLPGLNDALIGIKVGETRQIVLPAKIAFPDGVPEQAGIDDDDAVVFVVEPVAIESLDS